MTTFQQDYKKNISIHNLSSDSPNKISCSKLEILDNQKFLKHLNLLIPYAYKHPQYILDELKRQVEETSLKSMIQELYKKVCNSLNSDEKVWKGNVGEIIAASYITFLTPYELPTLETEIFYQSY